VSIYQTNLLYLYLNYGVFFQLFDVGFGIAESVQNLMIVLPQLRRNTGFRCELGELPGETHLYYLAGFGMVDFDNVIICNNIRICRSFKERIYRSADDVTGT